MKPKPSSIDISDSEDDLDSFPVTEIKPLGTSTKPAKGKKIGPKSRVQKKTTAKKDTKAKTTKAPKKANTEEEDIEEVELRSADNNDEAEKDGYRQAESLAERGSSTSIPSPKKAGNIAQDQDSDARDTKRKQQKTEGDNIHSSNGQSSAATEQTDADDSSRGAAGGPTRMTRRQISRAEMVTYDAGGLTIKRRFKKRSEKPASQAPKQPPEVEAPLPVRNKRKQEDIVNKPESIHSQSQQQPIEITDLTYPSSGNAPTLDTQSPAPGESQSIHSEQTNQNKRHQTESTSFHSSASAAQTPRRIKPFAHRQSIVPSMPKLQRPLSPDMSDDHKSFTKQLISMRKSLSLPARKSISMRGRRKSTLGGDLRSPPQDDIPISDFHQHVDPALPDPLRARQLVIWILNRHMQELPDDEEHNSIRDNAERLVDALLAKEISLSWYHKEEAPVGTQQQILPNPVNLEFMECISVYEKALQDLEEEEAQWKKILNDHNSLHAETLDKLDTRLQAYEDPQSGILATFEKAQLSLPAISPSSSQHDLLVKYTDLSEKSSNLLDAVSTMDKFTTRESDRVGNLFETLMKTLWPRPMLRAEASDPVRSVFQQLTRVNAAGVMT